jgi:hypothetical protein
VFWNDPWASGIIVGMYELSEREAFEVMTRFLTEFYGRAGTDMETLLADISIEADGGTLDPAAWDDWTRCVRAVKGEIDPQGT